MANYLGYHHLVTLYSNYRGIKKKSVNWIIEAARTNEFE